MYSIFRRANLSWSHQHFFPRSFSSKVLLDQNIQHVLREKEAVKDLLGAVWGKYVVVHDTNINVQRTVPAVKNPLNARVTFAAAAHIFDPKLHCSSIVTIDIVRKDPEVPRILSPNYAAARARMHAVVKDQYEFVKLRNMERPLEDSAFDKLQPVHGVTICDYVPVRLDSAQFREKALAADYSPSEVDAIIQKYTIGNEMWYPVESIQQTKRNTFTVSVQPRSSVNKDSSISKDKPPIEMEPMGIPNSVEIIRPQVMTRARNDTNIRADSPYAEYLSKNMGWTFLNLPIFQIRAPPNDRLRQWADFFFGFRFC